MMASIKSFVAGLSCAIAAVVLTATAAQALIIPSSVTGTVRDTGGNGNANQVFLTEFQVNHPSNTDDRGIVEFDISGQTMPVGQATLNLTRVGTSGVGLLVQLLGYGPTGANGAVELTDFDLGTAITSFVVPSDTAISIPVTNFINTQIGLSSAFVGFNLRSAVTSPPLQVNFVVSAGQTTPLPTLDLGDAPVVMTEPGTIAILGVGLLGLGCVTRRRTR